MKLNRQELTKLVSRLEDGESLPGNLYAPTRRAHVVGITGPLGVGKSALIDRLIEQYRRAGRTVAVLAVDPSSPVTGGALLGDRLRMQRHSADPGVFIRSLAARRHRGGLAAATPAIVRALDAAGFDIILVETIGAGQNDVAVAKVADTVVVVLMPELGDAIQQAKAGLMEIADIVVINKADLQNLPPGAAVPAGLRPTIRVSAKTSAGVSDLMAALAARRDLNRAPSP